MDEIFSNALPILMELEKNQHTAVFVGGSVRDYLLRRRIHDIDIATSATPNQVKAIFPKTVDVGIEHGTILVLHNGYSYEVTTFRTEDGYVDFRRPTNVSFVKNVREDLKRRDFTINAIAMDKSGKLIDPFHGEDDLSRKRIVAVGDPQMRFGEDALRIMRAVRFVSQLGFTIQVDTRLAMKQNVHLLSYIAQERKTAEFTKLLAGAEPLAGLSELMEVGILDYLPFFDNEQAFKRVFQLDLQRVESIEEWWALLMVALDVDVQIVLRDWKLSSATIKKVSKLVKGYHFRQANEWQQKDLFDRGLKEALSIERLWSILDNKNADFKAIQNMYQAMAIHDKSMLDINGHDLISWSGEKAGPWVKDALDLVLNAILDGQVENKREKIKTWILQKSIISGNK